MIAAPTLDLRRYVLGGLSEEERLRLDAQLLADPALLRAVKDAEEELIEDYLEGTLVEDERSTFERYFLAVAENRQNVEDARVLRHLLPSADLPQPRTIRRSTGGPRWKGLAAAGLFLAAAASLIMTLRSASRPGELTVSTAASAPTVGPTAVPSLRSSSARRLATLRLFPHAVRMGRSAPLPLVRLPAQTEALGLMLFLEHPVGLCRAVLSDSEGAEIWYEAGLRPTRGPQGDSVVVEIPAGIFRKVSSYKVTLLVEPSQATSGAYSFEVRRD